MVSVGVKGLKAVVRSSRFVLVLEEISMTKWRPVFAMTSKWSVCGLDSHWPSVFYGQLFCSQTQHYLVTKLSWLPSLTVHLGKDRWPDDSCLSSVLSLYLMSSVTSPAIVKFPVKDAKMPSLAWKICGLGIDGWMDGWLGFNGILSTQVAAISCLRKFKVC